MGREIHTYGIAAAATRGMRTFDAIDMVTTAASSDGGTRMEYDALVLRSCENARKSSNEASDECRYT
jgi:hypothetical protein